MAECYVKYVRVAVRFLINTKVCKVSQVEAALTHLRNYMDENAKSDFIERQVQLLSCKRYVTHDLVLALSLRSVSAACYERIREVCTLPSTRLLRRVTKVVNDADDETYIKAIFDSVDTSKRYCTLLFDEVYIKPCMQYEGDTVYGAAVNVASTMATTVLAIMCVCLFGTTFRPM
jgi:hypothetical protein